MPTHSEDKTRDPDFREFVRWCALPKRKRKSPDTDYASTQKEFAEKRGMSSATLSKWKKREEYDELMQKITERWLADSIPQVVHAAREVATDPSPAGQKDREMLLDMANELGHKHLTVEHDGDVEHKVTMEDARTMSEGELRGAMRAQLRKQPRFADASDEQLDSLIDAFVSASGSGGGSMPEGEGAEALPASSGGAAAKDAEYVIAEEPPDQTDRS